MVGVWKNDTEYEVLAALRLIQCAKRVQLNKVLLGLTGKRATLAIVTSSAKSSTLNGVLLESSYVSLENQCRAESWVRTRIQFLRLGSLQTTRASIGRTTG